MRSAAMTLILAALALSACGGTNEGEDTAPEPTVTGALPAHEGLLFLLRGNGSVGEDTIEVRAQTVDWFTDRPRRRAGTAAADELISNWKAYGFARVAPNAAVAAGEVEAEVVLSRPAAVDEGLVFEFKTIHGRLPAAEDEQVIVFIDGSGGAAPSPGYSSVTIPGWDVNGGPTVIPYGAESRDGD